MLNQMIHDDDFDRYEDYEITTKKKYKTRRQRRKKKVKDAYEGKSTAEERQALFQTLELSSETKLTYMPSIQEAGWVMAALKPFYDDELIVDVLQEVKGGKEANVYLCEGHPSIGKQYVAAKVYRPKIHRQLRNDKMYKEGRALLGGGGDIIHDNNKRSMRAIKHKSGFGDYLKHQSWMMHEYKTLAELHEEGANVPDVYGMSDNGILMDFIGDVDGAAPILHGVSLKKMHTREEVFALFNSVIDTMGQMLRLDYIHGDLSAYNILYWDGALTLIDFPQVVTASTNGRARAILKRDVVRVCDYFKRQGVGCNPHKIADALWHQNMKLSEKQILADVSRVLHQEEAE